MKRFSVQLTLVIAVLIFASCGKKKENNVIITKKPKVMVSNKVLKMGDYEQTNQVNWDGSPYTIKVKFAADKDLPLAREGNQKYYDNKIELQIKRKDGTDFFHKTFTKSDFIEWLSESYKKNSALLGIVYYETKSDGLKFAASVGSPDKMSDEFVPFVLTITKEGRLLISKDTQLDTGGNEGIDEGSELED